MSGKGKRDRNDSETEGAVNLKRKAALSRPSRDMRTERTYVSDVQVVASLSSSCSIFLLTALPLLSRTHANIDLGYPYHVVRSASGSTPTSGNSDRSSDSRAADGRTPSRYLWECLFHEFYFFLRCYLVPGRRLRATTGASTSTHTPPEYCRELSKCIVEGLREKTM